jgi:hypothetical protein
MNINAHRAIWIACAVVVAAGTLNTAGAESLADKLKRLRAKKDTPASQAPASAAGGGSATATSSNPASRASAPVALDTNVPDGLSSIKSSRVGHFDVQGLRLGMTSAEIVAEMKKRGYKAGVEVNYETHTFSQAGPHDNKTVIVAYAHLAGTNYVHRIQYNQRFTGRFDPAAAREQVIAKYGKPSVEQAGTLTYTDGDDPMTGKSGQPAMVFNVRAKCAEEILRRGGTRGLELGEANAATEPGVWASHEGARVRERCPDTLPFYLSTIRAVRAPRMTVNINPSYMLLAVEMNSTALREEPVIQARRKEEERLRKAPVSRGDL